MIIRIGLENGIENRSLAWALDYPGCFAYGEEASTALLKIPHAVIDYETWMNRHTPTPWVTFGDFDVRLVEVWQVYHIDQAFEVIQSNNGYEVNAWFRDDWKILTQTEVKRGIEMLAWSRADLLESIHPLTPDKLDATFPNERWSIRGIVNHVATAEKWYLNQLDLPEKGFPQLPDDPVEKAEWVRSLFNQELLKLAGVKKVVGKNGEFWSPRKLLRRAIWHELDHIEHIRKLKMAFTL